MGVVGVGLKRAVISIPPRLRAQQNYLYDWWDYRCIAGLSLHSNRTGWNSVIFSLYGAYRVVWVQVHLVGDQGQFIMNGCGQTSCTWFCITYAINTLGSIAQHYF